MEKNYFEHLSDQYYSSLGYIPYEDSSKGNDTGFGKFILERNQMGKKYCEFLNRIGFGLFDNNRTAEVGKGSLDSVVKHLRPSIITPFRDNFFLNNPYKVIVSKFTVYAAEPYLIELGSSEIQNSPFDVYMTQNPYGLENIEGWEEMLNEGTKGIIVGFYGKNSDKDKEEKIELGNTFASLVYDDACQRFESNDDCYYYAVGTRPKKLEKILNSTTLVGA